MAIARCSPLWRLENESIHILRETFAEARRPVLLYSIGKDSSVLLHLARKAFHPAPLPLPLLHIDTGWKFRAMIAFRDRVVREAGLTLIAHHNAAGAAAGADPFGRPGHYTRVMKTEALRAALDAGGFDVAIGGARRDEERARAKERIVSIRGPGHRWDPREQRPEMWNLFNLRLAEGQSARVFPLSNWTELDIWTYIAAEEIPIVDLYYAAPRPVVRRDGALIVVDDDRIRLAPGETVAEEMVRFRTLGCWPLTGAVHSTATSLAAIIEETRQARRSERAARLIDREAGSSLEQKKREGYF